jgi:hypothetical protein
MYRSNWELATYVRHHIADLTDDRRSCAPITQSGQRPASLLTPLRHGLGIRLIKAGRALAGYDAMQGLSTSPARPATWGSSS